jgi:hypothetical protein
MKSHWRDLDIHTRTSIKLRPITGSRFEWFREGYNYDYDNVNFHSVPFQYQMT